LFSWANCGRWASERSEVAIIDKGNMIRQSGIIEQERAHSQILEFQVHSY
jgi:hypothetical protein